MLRPCTVGAAGWASVSEGAALAVRQRRQHDHDRRPSTPLAWLTRLASNDEVLITVDEDELLEFYEFVPQGLDVMAEYN